ncbi:transcriptional regulator [Halorubrum salipaludis]|uniref:Transcriptional regulator n=1 Tax=Halorubrum salipaludis TaxID=2032630 RepID=A0A2A2FKU3_9EURY|nr:transcriptional regulator [Halorubrum salipaludis]PAU85262.1 transcriptional regulator [Halorubrum salipaludis]
MTVDDGHDGAQYLAGSPVRVAMLRAIREEPRRPAGLTDAVDATRTTVQRILSGFRERDWVVKRGAAYHVTPTGKRVHDAYEALLDEVEVADRYGRFAADLERVGADFPPAAIDAGELTVAADRNPLAAVDRLTELLHEGRGSEIRAVSPVVIQQFNDAAAEALDGGAEIELIIDRDVVEESIAEFGPATDRALHDDGATVYVSPEPLEYGIFRYDDLACVTAYDRRNNPRCVLESTDQAVVEWVDERFESFVAEAQCLSAVVENA